MSHRVEIDFGGNGASQAPGALPFAGPAEAYVLLKEAEAFHACLFFSRTQSN